MANRPTGIRTNSQSKQIATSVRTNEASSRVAAKAADIEMFADLIRERKRLNERQNEGNNNADRMNNSNKTEISSNTASKVMPSVFSLQNVTNRSLIAKEQTQIAAHGVRQLSLSVTTSTADGAEPKLGPKNIEALQAVIQRIIGSHTEAKEPKTWLIRLTIDGVQTLNISLQYLGKNEWQLGIDADDDRENQGQTGTDNVEELFAQLETEVRLASPGLRFSAIAVDGVKG